MKPKILRTLPLFLAAALQLMPMLRGALPQLVVGQGSSTWGIIFRWAAGGVAMFGFHAISGASSISISPPNATVGSGYVGTISYSGSHAGSVSSMAFSNTCLSGTIPFLDGMTIKYNGVNTASVTGTPTNAGTYPFSLRVYSSSSCGGLTDLRSTSLVVGTGTGGTNTPSFTAAPQSVTAQVGSDVQLSAGASGNPVPKYLWKLGTNFIAGATNSILSIPAVQFTNAGLYTVLASNGPASTATTNCFLSVCRSAGADILSLNYTNYAVSGQSITLTSSITNVPNATNTYSWQYNHFAVGVTTSNWTLLGTSVVGINSGIYTIVFNSVLGTNTIVPGQAYDSYWAFGTAPVIGTQPQSTNISAGSNLVLAASASVSDTPYGTNQPVTFLWFLNDTNLVASHTFAGTNQSASLSLSNISSANAGTYRVVATNFWGSSTSSPAILSVINPVTSPGIDVQPSGRFVLVGQNTSFGVAATGTGPLSYSWRKDGGVLSNVGVYSGAFTNVLVLTGVGAGNAGSYNVVITNTAGSITSNIAPLAVLPPPSLLVNIGSGLQLSATTVPGLLYVAQMATNLDATPVHWTDVYTNNAQTNGVALYNPENTNGNFMQFYRLRFP